MFERLRRWARGHTRRRRYSPVGVAFHWSMAALVLFQLWWGWRTGRLPVGFEKLEAYRIHSQIGLVILLLALMRMAWRLVIPGPINDADTQGWQTRAAHLTHYTFYACLIGLPLSGWAMFSATAPEQPLTLFGLPWPRMPFQDLAGPTRWRIEAWAEWIHFGFIMALLILIPLHVGAALKHHFVDRHDVLRGMVPGIGRLERRLLAEWRRIRRALRSPDRSGADRSAT